MATPDHLLPVFSFRPNWRDRVAEALEWLTDVLGAKRTGAEQRIALRLTPRRSFEARLDLLDAERTFADMFIRRFHGEEFMLPLWHDHATLTSAVSAGASTLPFDTVDREFVDDGMALLVGPDALSCEAVRIATVGASSLTLLAPVANAWRAGTVVHPLRRSRFDPKVSAEHITDRLDQLRLRFGLSQANDYDGGVEELATYSGMPILSPAPNWSGTIDMEHIRALFEVDNKIGLKHVGDPAARGFSSQRHRWMLEGRASLAAFYRLLYRLRGRQGSIWVPTFTSDLTLAAGASAGATSIDVVKCGLDYAEFPAAGRQHAITPGGEVLHFSALAAPPSAGVERLNLSAPLATALAAGVKLSWLDIGRLDSDRIELVHETDSDGVTTVEAPFRTYSNTRDGSADGALDLPEAEMTDEACNAPVTTPGGTCGSVIYNGPLVITMTVPDPLPAITLPPFTSYMQLYMMLSVETPSGQTLTLGAAQLDFYNASTSNPPPDPAPVVRTVYDPVCDRFAQVTTTAALVGGVITLTSTINDVHFKFAPNWVEPDQVADPSWWDHPYVYQDWVGLNVIGDDAGFPSGSFSSVATISVGGVAGPPASEHEQWYVASTSPLQNGYQFRFVAASS